MNSHERSQQTYFQLLNQFSWILKLTRFNEKSNNVIVSFRRGPHKGCHVVHILFRYVSPTGDLKNIYYTHPFKSIRQPAQFANFFMCIKFFVSLLYISVHYWLDIGWHIRYFHLTHWTIHVRTLYILYFQIMLSETIRYYLVTLSRTHYYWCMLDPHNTSQLQINFWSSYNDCKTTDSGGVYSMSWANGWRYIYGIISWSSFYVIVCYKQHVQRYTCKNGCHVKPYLVTLTLIWSCDNIYLYLIIHVFVYIIFTVLAAFWELYPRNLKFRGYYGFGLDAAAAARQGLCFT